MGEKADQPDGGRKLMLPFPFHQLCQNKNGKKSQFNLSDSLSIFSFLMMMVDR